MHLKLLFVVFKRDRVVLLYTLIKVIQMPVLQIQSLHVPSGSGFGFRHLLCQSALKHRQFSSRKAAPVFLWKRKLNTNSSHNSHIQEANHSHYEHEQPLCVPLRSNVTRLSERQDSYSSCLSWMYN